MITKLLFIDGAEQVQVHPISAAATCWSSLEKIQGLGSPQPRAEVFDRARRHGQVNRTQFYSGRVLDIQGRLVVPYGGESSNVMDFFDDLKGLLALGTDVTVQFRRRGFLVDEYVIARVASPVEVEYVPRDVDAVYWSVQLLAGDPRMFSIILNEDSYSPGDDYGVDMPLFFPLVFGTPERLEVTNGGNFATPPVITIFGPVQNPRVDNLTTDKTITLTSEILANESLEIDVGERTVTYNSTSRPDLIDASETEWWELEPGENIIRLAGSGMTDDTSLALSWRDARI